MLTVREHLRAVTEATKARKAAGHAMTFQAGQQFLRYAPELVELMLVVDDYMVGGASFAQLACAIAPFRAAVMPAELIDHGSDHRAYREARGAPKLAIEIHGPRRDYDYSLFCCDHNNEASQCAEEWTAEVIDELDAGEDADFRIVVRQWNDDDECCECAEATRS